MTEINDKNSISQTTIDHADGMNTNSSNTSRGAGPVVSQNSTVIEKNTHASGVIRPDDSLNSTKKNQDHDQSGNLIAGKYEIIEQLRVASAEADIFTVRDRGGVNFILKHYRYGIEPKEEIIKHLMALAPDQVIKIIEFGQTQDGRFYEIQEYAKYGSLDIYLKEHPGPDSDFIRHFIKEMLGCLIEIHSKNIIHRDIKPSNILIRSLDPPDFVLTDFGISSISQLSLHQTSLSATILYSSPESITGVVSKATDYWALGLIIFEMLTGRNPYSEMNERAVLYTLATKQVPGVEAIGGEFAPAVRGLLTRDVRRRWQASELERFIAGEKNIDVYFESGAGENKTEENNGRAKKIRPYNFNGKNFISLAELLAEMTQNWEKAVSEFSSGRLKDFIGKELLDQETFKLIESAMLENNDDVNLKFFSFLCGAAENSGIIFMGKSAEISNLEQISLRIVSNKSEPGDYEFMAALLNNDLIRKYYERKNLLTEYESKYGPVFKTAERAADEFFHNERGAGQVKAPATGRAFSAAIPAAANNKNIKAGVIPESGEAPAAELKGDTDDNRNETEIKARLLAASVLIHRNFEYKKRLISSIRNIFENCLIIRAAMPFKTITAMRERARKLYGSIEFAAKDAVIFSILSGGYYITEESAYEFYQKVKIRHENIIEEMPDYKEYSGLMWDFCKDISKVNFEFNINFYNNLLTYNQLIDKFLADKKKGVLKKDSEILENMPKPIIYEVPLLSFFGFTLLTSLRPYSTAGLVLAYTLYKALSGETHEQKYLFYKLLSIAYSAALGGFLTHILFFSPEMSAYRFICAITCGAVFYFTANYYFNPYYHAVNGPANHGAHNEYGYTGMAARRNENMNNNSSGALFKFGSFIINLIMLLTIMSIIMVPAGILFKSLQISGSYYSLNLELIIFVLLCLAAVRTLIRNTNIEIKISGDSFNQHKIFNLMLSVIVCGILCIGVIEPVVIFNGRVFYDINDYYFAWNDQMMTLKMMFIAALEGAAAAAATSVVYRYLSSFYGKR